MDNEEVKVSPQEIEAQEEADSVIEAPEEVSEESSPEEESVEDILPPEEGRSGLQGTPEEA